MTRENNKNCRCFSLSFVLFCLFFPFPLSLSLLMKNFFRDIAGERMAHAQPSNKQIGREFFIYYLILQLNEIPYQQIIEGNNWIFAGWVVIICIYSRILTSLILVWLVKFVVERWDS